MSGDVARGMAGTARLVVRLLGMRELEDGDDLLATEGPLIATRLAASVRSRTAVGLSQQTGGPNLIRVMFV